MFLLRPAHRNELASSGGETVNPVPGIRSRGIAALPFGDDAHSPTTGEASRGTGGFLPEILRVSD